jgi:heme iron utilization protein
VTDTGLDAHTGGGIRPLTKPTPSRRPSGAEAARTVVEVCDTGALATLTTDPAGYPFGSVVPYIVDGDGSPIVCISTMATHTRNLADDPRCSLLAVEAPGPGHPMDNGRVTLLGTAHLIADDHGAWRERYLERHPTADVYVDYGDFSFWSLDVTSVRWVGGFGRMSWVDAESYRAASPDPLGTAAAGALRHLNDDHADAMLAVARAYTGYTDATSALAVRLDRFGLDLDLVTPRGETTGRAPWLEQVDAADDLRMAAVALTRAARKELGEESASAH